MNRDGGATAPQPEADEGTDDLPDIIAGAIHDFIAQERRDFEREVVSHEDVEDLADIVDRMTHRIYKATLVWACARYGGEAVQRLVEAARAFVAVETEPGTGKCRRCGCYAGGDTCATCRVRDALKPFLPARGGEGNG